LRGPGVDAMPGPFAGAGTNAESVGDELREFCSELIAGGAIAR
jgi:hypothetical protein